MLKSQAQLGNKHKIPYFVPEMPRPSAKRPPGRPLNASTMQKLLFTGTNFDEVKRLCGDRVLAPYFCMGFSMLSVDTGEGFVSVNEGDVIVREDDDSLRIEKQG